jgi:DNA-directed RNA polymerase subunit H (RpoH/RPB5)
MSISYYVIYNNIFLYLKHRGLKLKDLKTHSLDLNAFNKKFNDDGYVSIMGEEIVILLIHPEKKYYKLDNNTKALIKKYVGNNELLIVSNVSYNNDQNISKMKTIINFMDTPSTLINFRSYMSFLYDIPNHALSSKHKIVSKDDIASDFSLVYLSIKELPKIFDHDTQATWLGAVLGDIIEIERISPVAGVTIVYREVISKVHLT